jgi:hypothetical protein
LKPIYFFIFYLLSNSVYAISAWSPFANTLWIQPTFVQSEYNNPFLPSPYQINIFATSIQYGITDKITFDFYLGYGRIQKISNYYPYAGVEQENPSTTKHGFVDSTAGIRYKIFDEMDSNSKWMPTISLRIGGIKKGDYDKRPQTLGDGASGGEVNLYFAKDFNFYGLGTFGDIGYRQREKPVPKDQIYSWSIYKTIFENFYLITGYRGQRGLGGYPFSDPAQNESQIPSTTPSNSTPIISIEEFIIGKWLSEERPDRARRENFLRQEFSIAYRDSYGNFYTFYYSKTVKADNSPALETFGLTANFSFFL